MLQFNPDGSLKLSSDQLKQNEREKHSIIISKEQISEKPAKAQIVIRFPENVQNPDEITGFYRKIQANQFRSVEHSISQFDGKTFIIKVETGSMLMYGLLNFMADCFRDRLAQKSNVIVKGSWAKTVF